MAARGLNKLIEREGYEALADVVRDPGSGAELVREARRLYIVEPWSLILRSSQGLLQRFGRDHVLEKVLARQRGLVGRDDLEAALLTPLRYDPTLVPKVEAARRSRDQAVAAAADHVASLRAGDASPRSDEARRFDESVPSLQPWWRAMLSALAAVRPPAVGGRVAFEAHGMQILAGGDGATAVLGRRGYRVFTTFDGRALGVRRDHVSLTRARMLPMQSIGVCFFHATVNMILNSHLFADALLHHLYHEIHASPMARRAGESPEQARSRRFLSRQANLTFSEPYEASEGKMKDILGSATRSADLYAWSRNVLLFHQLMTAMNGFGRAQGTADSQTYMMIKAFADARRAALPYDAVVKYLNAGGNLLLTIHDVLALSGLQVHQDRGFLVARCPRSGVALLSAELPPTSSWDEGVPDCGQCSGTYAVSRAGTNGHAMAYVRGDGGVALVNSEKAAPQSIASYRQEDMGMMTAIRRTVSYAIVMPEWPYAASGGSGGPDAREALRQAAILAPRDPGALATCDADVCAVDSDVADALEVAKDFLAAPPGGQAGGGPGGTAGLWSTLMGVILATTLMGH